MLCEGGWAPSYAIALLIGRCARRRLPWGAPDRRLSPSNPSRLSPPAGSLPPRCFTGVRAQTSGIPAWRRPSRMRLLSVGRSGLPLAAGSRSAVRRTGEPSYPVPLPYIPSSKYSLALSELPASASSGCQHCLAAEITRVALHRLEQGVRRLRIAPQLHQSSTKAFQPSLAFRVTWRNPIGTAKPLHRLTRRSR